MELCESQSKFGVPLLKAKKFPEFGTKNLEPTDLVGSLAPHKFSRLIQ